MGLVKTLGLGLGLMALMIGSTGLSYADDGADGLDSVVRKPMPKTSLPRVHADYSMFHFVPRGDEVTIQPEHGRLIFRKKSGVPDGYAERRGAAIVYYDSTGKAVRIQRLTPEELDRMTQ
ncbi:hypothetical protein [Bombella pollinis]|uniref:Uncharacterized protein n=1 Tax=Bombella pollinis TaxID=2967337 RepID=A0ABT3WML0_9PROT|nr:hypothetical protein [Bombella pollinis]MCX5620405.1 hypothetical protein [Bombella pollinis]